MLKFRNPAQGYVMILVAFLIPIVLTAVNYTTKRVAQSHKSTVKKSAIYAVAQAVLEKYNPAKTFDDQYLMLHTAAAVALNDRAFDLEKEMHAPLTTVTLYAASATTVVSASLAQMYKILSSAGLKNNSAIISKDEDYGSLLCDEEPLTDVVFNPLNAQISYKMLALSGTNAVRSVACYNPVNDASNPKKPTLTLNTASNRIECGVLGKTVSAVPAECNVDIVLTLPTNHAACATDDDTPVAPIVQISKAYAKFLKENFLHTRGAAVALVPYSAKISVPPDKSAWTVAIPPMNQLPDKPYLKQAIAYGTDGQREGGEIVSNSTQYDWGDADGDDSDAVANPNVGFPIMFRRGASGTYRGTTFYTGADLLSTANPIPTLNPTSNDLKFQCMNPNPCYLGHCNLLAGCCETNCPTYMANPYFITQLTDNIPDVIHDLGLIRPIDDPKNKSNFLFLAVQWAQMLLFETWTDHPNAAAVTNQKFAHPDREHKKKAIIFVVNGPDRFEPNELTYLGFNNDASEVPMFEADTINFNQNFGSNPIQSPNGILTFTTSADTNLFGYNATPPCYECKTDAVVTGTLAFPEKGWVKLTVAPGSATTTNNCIAWVKVNSPEMTPLSRNRIYARGSKIYRLRYHDYQLEYFDTTANNAAAGNTWTPIGTNTPGSAVSLINSPWGFTLCADEDKIYVTFRDYDSGSGTYLPYLLYFIDADGAGNRTWIKINSTNFPPDLTSSSFSGLGVYADGGKIYHIGYMSSQLYCFDTAAGNNTWTTIISDTAKETISYGNYGSWTAICVSNGKIYALDGWPGHLVYLNPTASNNVWTNIGTNTTGSDNNVAGSTRDLCVNNGKIYTMASVSGQLMYFIDADGAGNRTWTRIGVNTAGSLMADIPPVYNGQRTWCLTISGNKIYAIANDYDQLVCLDTVTPVPFTTAVPASITVAGIARDITERTDVYIQPSQITANEISLNMTNIRLISAEITNRPCTITTPTCSMSGTTDAIGITEAVAYIDTNVVAPISIDIEQDSASVTFSNVIGYTTPFDVSGTTTISSNQTITISPDTHKYVKQDDGNYRITLTLTNVKISNPQMVNTDTIFEYASIDLPEPSRIVDFSQNVSEKPAFIGAIAYGESATSLGNAGAEYNGGVGYWTAGESTGRPGISGFNRTFHGNIDGDFYLLVEHISGPVPSMNLFCGASSDADNTYNFSGLHRRFLPFDEISPSDYVDFEIGGVPSSVVKYIMAGFTVPVNHALYQYELQTYPNNEPHVAAAAVAIVTADACTKLAAAVADAEEDTKVYVIKYGTTDDALDSCADDPDNIYTVDSEAELNEALHEIAADIKSFAGYSAPQMAEI